MNKGFTLIEGLLAILISSIIMSNIYYSLFYLSKINYDDCFILDHNAFYQLRIQLALAEEIYVYDDEINYYYKDKEFTLKINDNRVYITPGYNLFFKDIENAYFEEDINGIYLVYYRNDKFRRGLIHQ